MLYCPLFALSALCMGVATFLSVCVYLNTGDGTYLKRTLKTGCGIVIGVALGVLLLCTLMHGVSV